MENSFHGFAVELKKLMEAKLELVKALAVAVGIDFGVLFPLLLILPLFVKDMFVVTLAIMAMMAMVTSHCIRFAIVRYLEKAAEVNIWWEDMVGK